MVISEHAKVRMQQRGVSQDVLDALLMFGRVRRKGSMHIVYMGRKQRRNVAADCHMHAKCPQILDRLRGLYAVLGDEQKVVTVSHRNKRYRFK